MVKLHHQHTADPCSHNVAGQCANSGAANNDLQLDEADRYSPEFHPYSDTYNVTPHALQDFVKNDLDFRITYETHLRPYLQLTTASEDWIVTQPEEKTHLVGFSQDQGGYGLATVAKLFLDLGAPQKNSQGASLGDR